MSAWIFVSEDKKFGKNQKGDSFWARVHKLYEQSRNDNPKEVGERNRDSMKGCFKRLNKNVNKWVAACKEAHGRKRSRMCQQDVEQEAHTIYEAGGSKF
ncbi:hypothetical protein ACS0TY_028259 [Phlomoides rotata]